MNLRTAFFILILMCIRYFGFGSIILKEESVSAGGPASTNNRQSNDQKEKTERLCEPLIF
jgi:hypothetical protein